MPIRNANQANSKNRSKIDVPSIEENIWPTTLRELPRGWKIMLSDLDLERFGFGPEPNLKNLRDIAEMGGKKSDAAVKCLNHIREIFLALMKHDGNQDNQYAMATPNPNVPNVEAFDMSRRVRKGWFALVPFIKFLDLSAISVRAKEMGAEQFMTRLNNSDIRQEALAFLAETYESMGTTGGKTKIEKTGDRSITMEDLKGMEADELDSVFEEKGFECTTIEAGDKREELAGHLGLIDKLPTFGE